MNKKKIKIKCYFKKTNEKLDDAVKLLVREENFEIYKVMQIQQFSPAN
jgi:hypothetical protein